MSRVYRRLKIKVNIFFNYRNNLTLLICSIFITIAFSCSFTEGDVMDIALDEKLPVSGAQIWLRASSGTYTDSSGGVYYWEDRSGSGNDARTTHKPLLVENALNGLPVLRFRGAQYMRLPEFMEQNNFTFFIVAKSEKASGRYFSDYGETTLQNFYITSYGSPAGNPAVRNDILFQSSASNNLQILGSTVYNPGQFHIITVSLSGTIMKYYYNGTFDKEALQSGSFDTAVSMDEYDKPFPMCSPTIGARANADPLSAPDYLLSGDIAEFIYYPRALSGDELAAVTAYLKLRYNL